MRPESHSRLPLPDPDLRIPESPIQERSTQVPHPVPAPSQQSNVETSHTDEMSRRYGFDFETGTPIMAQGSSRIRVDLSQLFSGLSSLLQRVGPCAPKPEPDTYKCCICHSRQELMAARCKHLCCGNCWKEVLVRGKTCPMCKRRITRRELRHFPKRSSDNKRLLI